ncbi:tetratricopeptide repeat protein [Micromonospora sp. C95]|uniref:tetratricopeptide repeat protein n=1 Tax=Micromonospora sp. C95 TaxID=2824882 RepID=UPI001B387814|nr:tetratricopeptide repeat protein [Micromonospora sp. C95]MBQ1027981.1 tetratricopeptide repeat protein [Micromonospora sp. C95]
MDLALVQRWYAINSEMLVHLGAGRSVRGRLAAVDVDSLVLITPTGPTLLLASAIEQVELVGPPEQPGAVASGLDEQWADLTAEFTPEATAPTSTRPTFRRDRTLVLDPAQAQAVDRELARASNQHAYTLKMRDPQRVARTIHVLTHLAEQWQYPPAYHLAALLLLSDREDGPASVAQAERWLIEAAYLGGQYAWDLAVLYLNTDRPDRAAEVLAGSLSEDPVEDSRDVALRTYLDIVVRLGDSSLAVEPLAAMTRSPSAVRTAVRAGLYLLHRLRPDRAATLEALLSSAEPTDNDLAQVLNHLGPPRAQSASRSRRSVAPPSGDRPVIPIRVPREVDIGSNGTGKPAIPTQQAGDGRAPNSSANTPLLYVQAAERKFHQGRFEDALEIARKGLDGSPDNRDLAQIAEDARRQIGNSRATASRSAGTGPARMPSTRRDSLYAQAQKAETEQKNLPRAEELYRRAIEAGDNTERSVRSLAWLLHRRKRSTEALDLLRDPAHLVRESLQHHNILSTILGDLGRWAESAEVLQRALSLSQPRHVQVGLLKRLIRAHQQSRDWVQAKHAASRLLTLEPRNKEFQDIVAELDRVERTGMFSRLDELLADSDWNPDHSRLVSPLLALHLDSCEYAGVSPAKVQSQRLGEKDVQELDALIGKLGVRRSGDRAAYNLSAARILRDIGLTDDDRFRRSLRAFAAAMGDFCAAERRAGDVTRAYYAESIVLGRSWDDMAALKVRQFVLSYHHQRPVTGDPPNFEKCLTSVLEVRTLRRSVLIGLLTLSSRSDAVRREIVNRTFNYKELRSILFEEICQYLDQPVRPCANAESYAGAWQEALRAFRQDLDGQRQSLQLLLNRPDPLGTVKEDAEELGRARSRMVTSRADRERLQAAASTLGNLHHYLEQSSYLEQERLELMNRTELREQVTDIQANPTPLSLEYLVPLLKRWESALAAHFAEVRRAAEPSDLDVSLVLPSYVPNAALTITVQLAVANAARRSPASDVMLRVLDNPDDYQPVREPIPVAHTLRDGQGESCALTLVVTPRAMADKVLTLRYTLEFVVRSGAHVTTDPESLSLRLYELSDFEPAPNPYSEGAPVENEQMFYGRRPLLDSLVESLKRSEAKCVVFYGQKRAGKSSVLYHLQRRLEPPLLAAKFSLLDLSTQLDHSALLYKIARAFHTRFEELHEEGFPALNVPEPRVSEFTTSGAPQIHFDEYMNRMRREMRRTDPFQDWRLVLLLDEFTMLYAAIERSDLPRGFMKSWKAMLESKLFSSVVVGNDLMPTFLAAYPNEFQVARQERLSYLDPDEAEALIVEPVLMADGESRYKGDSVERILELTARSPYYIQLFCNRLIESMNTERQPLIGPADVERMADALVHGDKALPQEQFDNLLTPGDADVSALSAETALAVLKACLTGHRRALYLDGRRAADIPEGRRVIEDMLRRDVIVHESEERYRIKVGLFAEWLWARKA